MRREEKRREEKRREEKRREEKRREEKNPWLCPNLKKKKPYYFFGELEVIKVGTNASTSKTTNLLNNQPILHAAQINYDTPYTFDWGWDLPYPGFPADPPIDHAD